MFFIKKETLQKNSGTPQYIICGLGNPGTKYENTRHNCGFMAIDTLCGSIGEPPPKKLKFKSLTSVISINGVKCFIMKPTTFMNLSGEAVAEAMGFYKLPPEKVIVIFDDVSLTLGSIRIKKKGSDGGHNGMKNIITLSGSDNFPRIKIGIDSAKRQGNLADFVTSPFKKDEGEPLEAALEKAADSIAMLCGGNIIAAMNKYNVKPNVRNS